MKIFTSLTLCSLSGINSIKYFYALMETSPQGRKYFISLYFPDTFIFHFPVKHKKHRPRGNRFVRKNSVLSAPSGVRTLDTLIKSHLYLILKARTNAAQIGDEGDPKRAVLARTFRIGL